MVVSSSSGSSGGISALMQPLNADVKAYQRSYAMIQDNFTMAKELLGDIQVWDTTSVPDSTVLLNAMKDISMGVFMISQQEEAKKRLKDQLININRANEVSSEVMENRTTVLYSNISIIIAIISIVIIGAIMYK